MLNIICFVVGLIGVCLTSYAGWLMYKPVGFFLMGLYCVIWSFLVSRSDQISIKAIDNENR